MFKGIAELIHELDELSWGFRIEKHQERGCNTIWSIFYINPKDKVWRTKQSESLVGSIQMAILSIKGKEHEATFNGRGNGDLEEEYSDVASRRSEEHDERNGQNIRHIPKIL